MWQILTVIMGAGTDASIRSWSGHSLLVTLNPPGQYAESPARES